MTHAEKIEDFDRQIAEITEQRAAVRAEWAAECPHKIGDTVTVPPEEYRRNGQKIQVDRIYIKRDWEDKYIWHIHGKRIKKDGEIGQRQGSFKIPIPD